MQSEAIWCGDARRTASFIGSVGPASLALDERGNTAPPAVGLDFFVKKPYLIAISGSFAYYRPELPDLSLCREVASETADPQSEPPVILRKRVSQFELTSNLELGTTRYDITISEEGDQRAYGAPSQGQYKISKDVLQSEEEFDHAKRELKLKPASLKLAASAAVTVSEDPLRGYRVQVRLINESLNPRWQSEPRLQRRIDRYEEPFLFDVILGWLTRLHPGSHGARPRGRRFSVR